MLYHICNPLKMTKILKYVWTVILVLVLSYIKNVCRSLQQYDKAMDYNAK
jgi:hypothetical protein